MNKQDFIGLAIDSPLALSSAANFCPPSWPPPEAWPVVIDEHGNTISVWSDSIWKLDVWSKGRCTLNFGDGAVRKCKPVNAYNGNLLRRVVGWWLYGPCRVRTAQTLHIRLSAIRPIFSLCTQEKINADELQYNSPVIDKIPKEIYKSQVEMVVFLLNELSAFSDVLGFELLKSAQITKVAAQVPATTRLQTPYIPPRIWLYQVRRLRECLQDFWNNRAKINELFGLCLDSYVKSYGSLEAATSSGKAAYKAPFGGAHEKLGKFTKVAEAYGLDGLLMKWVASSIKREQNISVDMLANYFSLVNYVAIAYILNFSLMRSDDAMQLKRGCLNLVDDPKFGKMYFIEGMDSKGGDNEIVHWVTSESSCLAIQILEFIGDLRRVCKQSIEHDRLYQSISEPWSCGNRPEDERNIPVALSYKGLIERYPH